MNPQLVHYVPLATTIIALVFAWEVLQRWWERRSGPHLTLFGWNAFLFRSWYIAGALLGGAPMAQGTVYLLLRRRTANILTAGLVPTIMVAALCVLASPLDLTQAEPFRLSGDVLVWYWVRLFSPFINTYALIYLVGGAILSAYRFRTNASAYHRFVGNVGEFNWSSQHLDDEVLQCRDGNGEGQTGRVGLRCVLPGRPPATGRAEQQRFWKAIARGLSSEDAAVSCGVSPPVGGRWFREGGGMPPISLAPRSARYLSFAEREEIAILRAQGAGVRDIARRLRRAPSTVSRELRRNAATRSGGLAYRASTAQWHSARRAKRPKIAKLAANDRLRSYVQDRLAGTVMAEDGTPVPGPNVGSWSGRRHGRRQDRHWATSWSPQQIAHRLRIEYPDDESMRVSHEAIYQALYIQGRGALRRELTACLRTGRALRAPRARRRGRGKEFVGSDIMISERPTEAEDRAVPGHWEGDLIIGLGSSAIGTLVERTTRFTMLLHLPRMAERGRLRVKNGLALAGHGAEAVRDAITSTITALPDQLRRSLTWDQGAEMAQHAQLRIDTGLHVFFCDPRSPWQRGTNENTNGLLRQYFPKGTDLNRHSASDVAAVAATLNRRPRKTLGWKTPSEAFNELLLSHQRGRVATTP